MIIYGKQVTKENFELQCNCGAYLGIITADELKSLKLGNALTGVDYAAQTVLCAKCELEYVANMSLDDFIRAAKFSINNNVIFSGITGLDTVPPKTAATTSAKLSWRLAQQFAREQLAKVGRR